MINTESGSFEFNLVPQKGALPIEFGMSTQEVREILGMEPEWIDNRQSQNSKFQENYSNLIGVQYDFEDRVCSVSFIPNTVNVWFNQIKILGKEKTTNPLKVLVREDKTPTEAVGFIFFEKLGITVTGFHDNNKSQRALSIYDKKSTIPIQTHPIIIEALFDK